MTAPGGKPAGIPTGIPPGMGEPPAATELVFAFSISSCVGPMARPMRLSTGFH